jgi:hypothetical protein
MDQPKCTECGHLEREHKMAAMCVGLGADAVAEGRFCPCLRFKRPFQNTGAYTPYVPPTSGFRQTSSKYELGEGGAGRPNLQDHNRNRADTPDWVMFGIRRNGVCFIYASTKLSFLELRQEAGYFDELHADLIRSGKISDTPWDLRGRMVDYVVESAPTYNEAIQRLFRRGWRPDNEPTTEDLQRQAAMEDVNVEPPAAAIESEPEIYDAEIVEEGY